jgi:phosphosulfolactate synthase (CoM biosynthesis protein A)
MATRRRVTAGKVDSDRAFSFLRLNARERKPRTRGLTEVRGPHYTPMGKRYLEDILETMGEYVDILKFACGSFSLMPRCALQDIIDLCHAHGVLVSTGGGVRRFFVRDPNGVVLNIMCHRPSAAAS